MFSKDVLDHGKSLFMQFSTLRRYIARFTRKLQTTNEDDEYSAMQIKNINRKKEKLSVMLRQFDDQWALYERSYVFELMVIEKDARRFVLQAIQQEQTL